MNQLLRAIWNVCLFKQGPQILPISITLLCLALIANVFVSWAQLAMTQAASLALLDTLLIISLTLAYVYLVLRIRAFSDRYIQTITALLACGVVITLLIWPFVYGLIQVMIAYDKTSFIFIWANISVILLILAANVWSILIMAHILRHAIGVPFAVGLLLALGLIALHIVSFGLLK